MGFESNVKLGGANGDGVGADGVGPGGGIPKEEPGWGGAFGPPLDEVIFADVAQHLCPFQVEEELDVFGDLGGAPVLVHVEVAEVAVGDEPVRHCFGVVSQDSVVAEEDNAERVNALAKGMDVVGGGGEGGALRLSRPT